MSEEKYAGGLTWVQWLRLLIWKFVHWLVRVDPEVMSGCPTIDRFQMQSKALLLGAVAGIALFSWGSFLLLFFPWFIALPLLCPVMMWIVLIDQFIGSAHWKLQGILRPAAKRRLGALTLAVMLGLMGSIAPLVLRLGIGGVTSWATATSATMAMSHATIEAEEEKERHEANAALRAGGEAEKQQIRRDMLGSEDAAVKEASDALKALNKQIDAAREKREGAAGTVTDNQVNADCELHGGKGSGCQAGKGAKYRAAQIRSAAANAAMGRAAADLGALEARRPEAESKYQDALKEQHAREADYLKAAQAVDERVARDTVPARNDPVMAYRALQKIYASPDGEATRAYSHLMLALLLTVELSYVLVSEYFAHASLYMVRLMGRTRFLAAKAVAELREKLATLFVNGEPRMSYRVLPRPGEDD
jgi:hypothetical protein